jgi:tetratricopeptide (TPR) repeat protein
MHDEIHSELKEIEKLARMERYHEALRRADALAVSNPDEPEVWATRGYVVGREGELSAAISDLSKCVALRGDEAKDFFARGRYLFKAGRYEEAVSDFTRVLELCDKYNSDYDRQAAYFFRADAYVRLGEYDKARADCHRVTDKGQLWTDKLRTIDEILAECR